MRLTKADIARWTIVLVLIVIAITIASLTVGRDIYYGSRDHGLWSFAIVNAAAYLFFLWMPVELAFIYYLAGDVNVWALNAIALGTAMLSESIDYLCGYLVSERIINRLIGKQQYERAEERIMRYGNIVIFIFNFLPLSSSVISLAAGMLKIRIKDALIFTATGLILKHLVMTLIFA